MIYYKKNSETVGRVARVSIVKKHRSIYGKMASMAHEGTKSDIFEPDFVEIDVL